jgi:hypothetical protein
MKQVLLIHAHKDLALLNGLIEQLRDDDFLIYVNVDRKSTLDVRRLHPAARLVARRIDVVWGDFSQVEAILHSLRQIVAEVPEFDKVLYLSAQDFPLLPNRRLKQELAGLAGFELLDAVTVGQHGWSCAHRYQYYYRQAAGAPVRVVLRAVNRLMRLCGTQRRMVDGFDPWGGSSWWALSRACIVELLQLLERGPHIERFFRLVECADELFFQTLVMNSSFRDRVLRQNFRYIQWTPAGTRNPKVLDEGDYERICACDAHFCRKVDSQASAALLPLLLALRESRVLHPR